MTQCERILRHLNDYGSITSLEAMTEYGIMRLASRISDLRGLGYPIEREFETAKNILPVQNGGAVIERPCNAVLHF